MLDENSKQNVRNHMNTLCQTALAVIDTMRMDEESDLVDRLEKPPRPSPRTMTWNRNLWKNTET